MRDALGLLTAAVAAAAAALALAGPAFPAYNSPTLRVDNASERLSGRGSLTVRLTTARRDDPTFRVTLYVPQRYTGDLAPPAGTQIGRVVANAQPLAGPDLLEPLTGVLRTEAPAAYLSAAAQCLATPVPDVDSVWLSVLTSPTGGSPIVVRSYLTAGLTGAEAKLGQAKLTLCLPPPAQDPFQPRVFAAALTLTNVLTNPATPDSYRWRAIFTPYASGAGPVDAGGAVEAQAVDTIPARITARAGRYDTRTRRLTVAGTVTEARAAVAASVRVLVGGRRAATVRADARGRYRASVRIRRPGRYALRATTTVAARTVRGCQPSLPLPRVRCLRSVVSGFTVTSSTVRVRVSR